MNLHELPPAGFIAEPLPFPEEPVADFMPGPADAFSPAMQARLAAREAAHASNEFDYGLTGNREFTKEERAVRSAGFAACRAELAAAKARRGA